jgi:hypothetical protein
MGRRLENIIIKVHGLVKLKGVEITKQIYKDLCPYILDIKTKKTGMLCYNVIKINRTIIWPAVL